MYVIVSQTCTQTIQYPSYIKLRWYCNSQCHYHLRCLYTYFWRFVSTFPTDTFHTYQLSSSICAHLKLSCISTLFNNKLYCTQTLVLTVYDVIVVYIRICFFILEYNFIYKHITYYLFSLDIHIYLKRENMFSLIVHR